MYNQGQLADFLSISGTTYDDLMKYFMIILYIDAIMDGRCYCFQTTLYLYLMKTVLNAINLLIIKQ